MNPIQYFAFGSNMSEPQMHARCPSARLIGPALLPGYRLAFCGYSQRWDGGVATAISDRNSKLQGVLYELSPEGLFTLDLFEGVPWIYQRKKKKVLGKDGQAVKAYVYLLRDNEPNTPSPAYFRVICDAYRRFNFNLKALSAAVKEVCDG